MASMTLKYGLEWPHTFSPLGIELEMIRQGGKVHAAGREFGEGLFFHFRMAESLAWPEDDHHRWSDLILETYLEERITVIFGPRDASKTRTISKICLLDYWAFPQTTLILMTSTTVQGLELRVWGDIKNLFRRARDLYPELAGNVVDAKHGLFTDDISDEGGDVRVMNKGIIGIPLLSSQNEYQGMALKNFAGIKQKRRRLVGDECFPAGEMVDTPTGTKPIEDIRVGDLVLSAIGFRKVLARSVRTATELVRIKARDGRMVVCTPNHQLLTQKGWIKACHLNEEHYILSAYEAMPVLSGCLHPDPSAPTKMRALHEGHAIMQSVRETVSDSVQSKTGVLQPGLCIHDDLPVGCSQCKNICIKKEMVGITGRFETELFRTHENIKPNERSRGSEKSDGKHQGVGHLSQSPGWQWHRANQGRMATDEDVSRGNLELRNQDGEMEWQWLSSCLQSGPGISRCETGVGSGRAVSHELGQPKSEGCQEGCFSCGAWVESIEVLEQDDPQFQNSGSDPRGCRVYNLQVEGHPSYSVNGLIVHNCQFIHTDYLKVLDSLDKGDFKCALIGNPIANNGKALDKVSEPKEGWGTEGEVTKTTTWRNKYNGVTINLVGTDSPNFDAATLNRFPYLINQRDADTVSARPGGKDSVEWWSLIMGVRKAGAVSDRVLTVQMVENAGGFKDCIWEGSPTMKVYGVDGGYGGDPCVATLIECGTEVGGKQVVAFGEQKIIPVQVSSSTSVEDQIAFFAKADCANQGVPDENVYLECGMRATLALSFARIMSPAVNAINFGGPATQRPVSNDLYIFDEKTHARRLKTCFEHYSKFVTELAFTVRVLVESGQARSFPMPAAEEFQKRETRFVYGDRHELETKIEYKARNGGESPNFSDSAMIAVEGARRLGFTIQNMRDGAMSNQATRADDWLTQEIQKHKQLMKRNELSYGR